MCGAPHLVRVVGEVDLVEDLGSLVLDGFHLHQMWRVLPGAISENTEGEREGNVLLGPHGKPRKQETGLSLTPTSTPNSRLSYVASQSPEFPAKKWDGDGSKSKGCAPAPAQSSWGTQG